MKKKHAKPVFRVIFCRIIMKNYMEKIKLLDTYCKQNHTPISNNHLAASAFRAVFSVDIWSTCEDSFPTFSLYEDTTSTSILANCCSKVETRSSSLSLSSLRTLLLSAMALNVST